MAAKSQNGSVGELEAFTQELLQGIGALVEYRQGVLEAVLPETHLGDLGGEGFARLAFDPYVAEKAGAQYLSLGSPLADELIAMASRMGSVTRWYINGLRWSQRRAIHLDQWKARFANARIFYDEMEIPFACHYLIFNFQVSYLSDEKREEVHTVVVDSGTLQPAPRLQEGWRRMRLEPKRDFYAPDADCPPNAASLTAAYQRSIQLLQIQIAATVATYQRRASRHFEMESLRINTFYDDTKDELRRRLERTEEPERRRTLEHKIEASEVERKRKLADAGAKHHLRVALSLLNAAIVSQPKVSGRVQLQNRYTTAEVSVVFDPLTGTLELPSCHVCHNGATTIHLCANGHLACDACILTCSACQRVHCRECGVGACSVCGRPLCAQSENRCPSCGQVTCLEHRGRCH